MAFTLLAILEACMLASSLSIDAFTAGFAYGSNKIKIPFLSVLIIDIICSVVTGVSLLAGVFLRQYLSDSVTIAICFIILFLIGMVKLLDSITRSIIRKHNHISKEIKFSLLNFKFILNLYANPEAADVNDSKDLSSMEAAAIAIALSLDGMAVGFGAAIGNVNGWVVFFCSLITNGLAIVFGCRVGNKIAHKIAFNLSWISGVVLIFLAFLKLA